MSSGAASCSLPLSFRFKAFVYSLREGTQTSVSRLQSIKKGYTLTMHSRFTRRQFMAGAVAAGAALAVPWYFDTGTAYAFYQSQELRMFAQPLRGVGPGGIPVAAPDAFSAPVTGVTHYSFNIAQFTDQLHPYLAAAFWWCKKGHRFRSHSQIPYHQSTSCRLIPAPTSLKLRSTRTQLLPMYMVGSHPGPVMEAHLPGLLLMANTARVFAVQQATSTNSSTLV